MIYFIFGFLVGELIVMAVSYYFYNKAEKKRLAAMEELFKQVVKSSEIEMSINSYKLMIENLNKPFIFTVPRNEQT